MLDHLNYLAIEIGERNIHNPGSLNRTADYILEQFKSSGMAAELDRFEFQKTEFVNVVCRLPGTIRPEETIVVGAHYDSVPGSPGANDNGTGVAALLNIAELMRDCPVEKSIHFIAFVNEESPYFAGDGMGSLHYARQCRARNDKISAMFSLETMGYYSGEPGSQSYPPGVSGYPDQGDFIGFVSNLTSSSLLRESTEIFANHSNFPFQAIAAPESVAGVSLSDHMCFWQMNYPAIMITDTAPFRYPHYHTPQDLPDKINLPMFTELVKNLAKTFAVLAGSSLKGL